MKIAPVNPAAEESGFTLTELLISSLILLIIAAALYSAISDVQRSAVAQAEMQAAVNDAHIAFQAIERCIRQAGNNPLGMHGAGIDIISSSEMHIKSDLTGSLGPGNPDKGDPDGDVNDSSENVYIRFNRASHSIEMVPEGGAAQIAAGNISDFILQYYDANGLPTNLGSSVREINVTIKTASPAPNSMLSQKFGIEISSSVRVEI